MTDRRLILVFGALLALALGLLAYDLAGLRRVLPMEARTDGASLSAPTLGADELRAQARAVAADCSLATDLWWRVLDRQPDDIEAFRAIALCSREPARSDMVRDTERALRESEKTLREQTGEAIALLRWAREVAPTTPSAREVLEVIDPEDGLDATELRELALLQWKHGNVDVALETVRHAILLDPSSVEGNIHLGYSLVSAGRVEEAREAFRAGLALEGTGLRMTRIYAGAVAWPVPFVGIVMALVGMALALVRSSNGATGAAVAPVSTFLVMALGAWFGLTADSMTFAILVTMGMGALAWMLVFPLRGHLTTSSAKLATQLSLVARMIIRPTLHRRIVALSTRSQIVLLAASFLAMVAVVPLVPLGMIRVPLLVLMCLLLLSSLGSLGLARLQESRSLRRTLFLIGAAGTIPHLVFMLYYEHANLFAAFYDPSTQYRLLAEFVVWLMSLWLALALASVLAESILEPLELVGGALAKVRGGDYDVKLEIDRRDEIAELAGAVRDMAIGLRERQRIEATFKRYVNPGVAERLVAGDSSVREGRVVHATVMFVDVRGFTSISESMAPTRVVELLNEYLARMEPVIRRWGGVVDKYLGDGMLVVWGVPDPITSGPLAGVPGERLAASAALQMLETLAAFNEELDARGLLSLAIGVGIHSGPVIAGPIGSPDRQEYTVIGDVVNTAQRVESIARGESPLLVTDAVAAVIRGAFVLVQREPVSLKGKRDPVMLHKLVSLAPSGNR